VFLITHDLKKLLPIIKEAEEESATVVRDRLDIYVLCQYPDKSWIKQALFLQNTRVIS
jgi:hypothetical protein